MLMGRGGGRGAPGRPGALDFGQGDRLGVDSEGAGVELAGQLGALGDDPGGGLLSAPPT
jgi:hypothetical protein